MKIKKRLPLLIIAAVLACVLLIPPVRAAAESALSVFRVADTKTIRISLDDLQALLAFAESEQDTLSDANAFAAGLLENAASDFEPISGPDAFTAFPFSLPAALKDETPELCATGGLTQSVILDTSKINAELERLGASVPVDDSLNGMELAVTAPPAVMAEYPDVLLVATQAVYTDAPDSAINSLRSSLLSIPAIPDNLRAQLSRIDPNTRDVYLPVIEGLGRETDLGGATGYLYASGDLGQVLSALPGYKDSADLASETTASALIWTRDGVLYCLAGAVSDVELIRIARSI